MVEESNANLPLFVHGCPDWEVGADGAIKQIQRRDHNWDWASEKVRGKARQFWSLGRWPLGFQAEKTRQTIEADQDIDQRMVWSPLDEDPVPKHYFIPKLRRYGEGKEDMARYRPGPAIYNVGDTPRQQKVIRDRLTQIVAQGKLLVFFC
jgi:hypothetical protein